jgi:hypothetical protein
MKGLFKSRVFWVALVTILVMCLGVFIPGYSLDIEHVAGLGLIAATCMISYAINPTGGILSLLISRKFLAAVLGFAVVIADSFHLFPNPLDLAALVTWVLLIMTYIVMLAKDPGNGWRGMILSRKFWAAVLGTAMVFLRAYKVELPAGLTEDSLIGMVLVACGVIANVGIQGPPPLPMPDPVIPEEPFSEPETVTVKVMKKK